MKSISLSVGLWLLATLTCAAEINSGDELIPYQVTRGSISSPDWEAGAEVYEKLGREGFDREPMVEIKPHDNPSDLPEPTVVHYSQPEPVLVDLKAALAAPEKPVKGGAEPLPAEDRVYIRIRDADRRGRCFLLAQDCDVLAEPADPSAAN